MIVPIKPTMIQRTKLILAVLGGTILYWTVVLLSWGTLLLADLLGDCLEPGRTLCLHNKQNWLNVDLAILGIAVGTYAVGLFFMLRRFGFKRNRSPSGA